MWYKVKDTITTDPKLHIIAQKSKSYRCEVISLWVHLLEKASQKRNAGSMGTIDFETIDYALEFTPNKSERIYKALEEKGMVKDGAVVNWGQHQADPTAAERKRRQREKEKQEAEDAAKESQDATPSHGDDTEGHDVTTDRLDRLERLERDKEEIKINLLYNFDIESFLDDAARLECKEIAKKYGWDFHALMKKYNDAIKTKKMKVFKGREISAFVKWCESFASKNAP